MNAWTPIRDENKEVLGFWARAEDLAREHTHKRRVSFWEVIRTFWR
jgi:hypothetical protein